MKPSELASAVIMGLIAWGVIFIFLRAIDIIQWHWFWVMIPIFLAAIIFILLVIVLFAESGNIG